MVVERVLGEINRLASFLFKFSILKIRISQILAVLGQYLYAFNAHRLHLACQLRLRSVIYIYHLDDQLG